MRSVLMIIVSMVAVTAQALAATPDPVPVERTLGPIVGEIVLRSERDDFRREWCELTDALNFGQLNPYEKMIVLQLRGRASYELSDEPDFTCEPEWQWIGQGEVGKVETESNTPVVSIPPLVLSELIAFDIPFDALAIYCATTSALNHNNLDAQLKTVVLQLRGRANLELQDGTVIPENCGAKGLVTETL